MDHDRKRYQPPVATGASLNHADWSLHRKGAQDQARHQRKVRDALKQNLADIVSEQAIITTDGKKVVKVPIRSLEEYRFRYGDREDGGVGTGDGDSKVGDVLGQSGRGRKPGRGPEAGSHPGFDYFEAEVSIDEIASLVFEESGVNPLEVDPEGFRERYLRRIECGRIWVSGPRGHLLFKAEVYAETPQATYLEGVYVAPERRGGGYGLRCLSQLTRDLLGRSDSVCLLVNELNTPACAFYLKAGYRQRAVYDTIFLRK